MSDNPTIGEWNRQFVKDLCTLTISDYDADEIANAHNAALAAERDAASERMRSVQDFYSRQLAAEREAAIAATQAAIELNEQLAAERAGLSPSERQTLVAGLCKELRQLREQLDAEREKREIAESGWQGAIKLKQQLAAAVEALRNIGGVFNYAEAQAVARAALAKVEPPPLHTKD